MKNERDAVLVLGATGGIGGAIARALGKRGHQVKALARDPVKARADWSAEAASSNRTQWQPAWVGGDAMDGASVVRAAVGARVIIHAVNPPGYRNWERMVLPMMENTIAAARASGARVVLPGTIYNFDPTRVPVIDADSPQRPRTRKGAIRVQLEQLLEGAAPDVPSLVVRAGDFFGADARASWFSQALVTPGAPVRRMLNPARGTGHAWAYLPDLAETFARLLEVSDRLRPFERVQFSGYVDETGTGMTDAVRRVVGRDVRVYAFPWWLMRVLSPFGGFPREVSEIAEHWRNPVQLDNGRLVELLGAEPSTPLDDAVATTLVGLRCVSSRVVGRASERLATNAATLP